MIYHLTFHLICFLERFVPYEVDVAAATEAGKGNLAQKLFFTVQSGIATVCFPSSNFIVREPLSILKNKIFYYLFFIISL